REIRHGADDRTHTGEALAQAHSLDAGEQRHDRSLRTQESAQLWRDLVELLRLECKDSKLGWRAGVGETRHDSRVLDGLAAGADYGDDAEAEAAHAPTVKNRTAHVAAADEPHM